MKATIKNEEDNHVGVSILSRKRLNDKVSVIHDGLVSFERSCSAGLSSE